MGSSTVNEPGVYGTIGIAASANHPGARARAVSSIDEGGNVWLFGGTGWTSTTSGWLNDLWQFDGRSWTWVSGSNSLTNQKGVYGNQGVSSAGNIPGSRLWSASWIDANNNFWLFGGQGWDSVHTLGYLNDLWKFNGINWIWVSGSDVANQTGVYGIQGKADSGNIPGARLAASRWIDRSGNLWLFGGAGPVSPVTVSWFNDLWMFDGTNWTWVSGSDLVNQAGDYGIQGQADGGNVPGARVDAVSWIDANNNFWLFGGYGYDSYGNTGYLNDLWKFDGTNWTWVSGGSTVNKKGNYGTQGFAAAGNVPGARKEATGWIDGNGNLWMFGGSGYDSAGTTGSLNDLWKFDGTNWAWVNGSNLLNQNGIYGTPGAAVTGNVPGARVDAVSWIDANGSLWMFGGAGYDSAGSRGTLNDLWKYRP